MAERALFVGWGHPVRGRERIALELFEEAAAFCAQAQQNGRLDSFEVVLLEPHGGDLYGFMLIRGAVAQLQALHVSDDFYDLISRANLVAERVGVVGGAVDAGLAPALERLRHNVDQLP